MILSNIDFCLYSSFLFQRTVLILLITPNKNLESTLIVSIILPSHNAFLCRLENIKQQKIHNALNYKSRKWPYDDKDPKGWSQNMFSLHTLHFRDVWSEIVKKMLQCCRSSHAVSAGANALLQWCCRVFLTCSWGFLWPIALNSNFFPSSCFMFHSPSFSARKPGAMWESDLFFCKIKIFALAYL